MTPRNVLSISVLGSVLASAVMFGAQPASLPPRVLMISIDGLMPSTYSGGPDARLPNLSALAATGAWARGVIGVVPTVTYPSHTTLITGVTPAVHGIVDNEIFDPEGRANGAWYWYARAIRAPTLSGAARARGLTAGAVSWPVTVGMDLDYNVPEFWRSNHPESRTLLEALSQPPHLFDQVAAATGATVSWPWTDRDRTNIGKYLLSNLRPHVMLLHLIELDTASHRSGPGSAAAREVLERIDGYIGELLATLDESGLRDETCVVIVSDHGFLPIEQQLQPNALFKQEGLLTVNESGSVTDWQAYFHASGGSGYVYLKNPADAALEARVGELLERLRRDPANGIESLWTRADLEKRGAHPGASFGIAMRPGFYTSTAHDTLIKPTRSRGGHGFDPTTPELHASLILSGPGVPRTGDLGIVRMTQIAPTLARMLGVGLSPQADEPLFGH